MLFTRKDGDFHGRAVSLPEGNLFNHEFRILSSSILAQKRMSSQHTNTACSKSVKTKVVAAFDVILVGNEGLQKIPQNDQQQFAACFIPLPTKKEKRIPFNDPLWI